MDLMDGILITLVNTLVCLVFPKLLSVFFTLKSKAVNYLVSDRETSESAIASFETTVGVES